MGSIRLHPEYGVNPSLDLCFWCGEASGVALLGYNKGKEAPREVMTSYRPCTKCEEQMARGITVIEAAESVYYPDRPQIQAGLVPTGRWQVMTQESIERMLAGSPMLADVIAKRKCFVEPKAFETHFLPKDVEDTEGEP